MIKFYAVLHIFWIIALLKRSTELGESLLNQSNLVLCLVPCFEIGLFILILDLLKHSPKKSIQIIRWILSLFFLLILSIQCYYYYISGEYVTSLALENMNQAYLVINNTIIAIFCLICSIWVMINIYNNNDKLGGQNAKIYSAILAIILIIQNCGIIGKLLPPSPVISFFKVTGSYLKKDCLASIVKVDGYPFMKQEVYATELPYATKQNIDKPNIIILFTEGTSSRLLECYGGHYENLTPNISSFSADSNTLLVKNYYNHTAATFRGTHGQLASCYPLKGGYGNGQWADANNKDMFSKINYQTLPNILNQHGYNSIFMSPHKADDPYTSLLKMLKFTSVKTLQDYSEYYDQLNLHHESLQDRDMYKWIKDTLNNKENDTPVLLCAYTFETHTGVDVANSREKYIIDNPSLNTLHNMDAAFGEFWRWFKQSKYAKNTIVVLTADHAHYYGKDYVSIAQKDSDYKKVFVDKIPLLIYDPIHELPKTLDVNGRTSLDLIPTLLHLLSIKNEPNSFLGKSLFEKSDNVNMAALGREYYLIKNGEVLYKQEEIDKLKSNEKIRFQEAKDRIERFYNAESNNKIFKNN